MSNPDSDTMKMIMKLIETQSREAHLAREDAQRRDENAREEARVAREEAQRRDEFYQVEAKRNQEFMLQLVQNLKQPRARRTGACPTGANLNGCNLKPVPSCTQDPPRPRAHPNAISQGNDSAADPFEDTAVSSASEQTKRTVLAKHTEHDSLYDSSEYKMSSYYAQDNVLEETRKSVSTDPKTCHSAHEDDRRRGDKCGAIGGAHPPARDSTNNAEDLRTELAHTCEDSGPPAHQPQVISTPAETTITSTPSSYSKEFECSLKEATTHSMRDLGPPTADAEYQLECDISEPTLDFGSKTERQAERACKASTPSSELTHSSELDGGRREVPNNRVELCAMVTSTETKLQNATSQPAAHCHEPTASLHLMEMEAIEYSTCPRTPPRTGSEHSTLKEECCGSPTRCVEVSSDQQTSLPRRATGRPVDMLNEKDPRPFDRSPPYTGDEGCDANNPATTERHEDRDARSYLAPPTEPVPTTGKGPPAVEKALKPRLQTVRPETGQHKLSVVHTSRPARRKENGRLATMSSQAVTLHIAFDWPQILHLQWQVNVRETPNLTPNLAIHDASESAYGAVATLRTEDHQRNLHVPTRKRIASRKQPSILRLELCATITGAQLAVTLKDELTVKLTVNATVRVLWTDPTTAPRWLKSESHIFMSFAGRGLMDMQPLVDNREQCSVRTEDDPTADITRGETLQEIADRDCRRPQDRHVHSTKRIWLGLAILIWCLAVALAAYHARTATVETGLCLYVPSGHQEPNHEGLAVLQIDGTTAPPGNPPGLPMTPKGLTMKLPESVTTPGGEGTSVSIQSHSIVKQQVSLTPAAPPSVTIWRRMQYLALPPLTHWEVLQLLWHLLWPSAPYMRTR